MKIFSRPKRWPYIKILNITHQTLKVLNIFHEKQGKHCNEFKTILLISATQKKKKEKKEHKNIKRLTYKNHTPADAQTITLKLS